MQESIILRMGTEVTFSKASGGTPYEQINVKGQSISAKVDPCMTTTVVEKHGISTAYQSSNHAGPNMITSFICTPANIPIYNTNERTYDSQVSTHTHMLIRSKHISLR